MKLYDEEIHKIYDMIILYKDNKIIRMKPDAEIWPDAGDSNMILRNEMAFELGGENNYAISSLAFTSDEELVSKDEIIILGHDFSEIKEDCSYARLTIIRTDTDCFSGDDAYMRMRQIEYTRYHVNPKGYMMRVSVAGNREPARIGKKEIEEGINLNKVGTFFIDAYKKHKEVRAVKVIFVTLPEFSFEEIKKVTDRIDKITESLNNIYNGLVMDCSVCNLKNVCDTVEGLREEHFSHNKNQKIL